MHAARKLAPWAPLLLVVAALAGCAGKPQEADQGNATGNATTTPPTTGGGNGSVSGFEVRGLRIAPADGANRSLHEDDQAVVTYTLANAGTATGTFLVSYVLNGNVADVQHVTLAPGATKDVERRLGSLYDLKDIRVEVRAGSQKANAQASVTEWPRTGERVDLGPVTITVNRWLKNQTDGGTDVNMTAERKAEPEGNYSLLRIRVLCADAAGKVAATGEERPNVPEPGMGAMSDVHLPGCPHTLYGVEFTGKDATGEDIYTRILFVERGWRPAG